MAPARTEPPVSWETEHVSWPGQSTQDKTSKSSWPRNIEAIDAVKFDDNLQPSKYDIFGTHPDSKILFTDVSILDSTGREPYHGDVLIEGEPPESQILIAPSADVWHNGRRKDCGRW